MTRLENIQKEKEFMLNIETPIYKVIGFDEKRSKENRKHKYYFIQCKKCGTIFSRRASIIKENLNTIQCSHCRKNRFGKPLNVLEYKMYCFYRSGAKQRHIEWSLSEEEFKTLIKDKCHYCGEEPSRHQSVSYRDDFELVNGIDRIDSSKGYSIDNCVSCCNTCNLMKNVLAKNIFLNKVSQIYNYSIKSSTTIPKGSTSQANGDGSGSPLAGKAEGEDIVSTSMET